MIEDFRVDLTSFRGPLDLLLYLVRKHEVDVTDVPIALITKQYLEYLEILEQIDVNGAAEFLDLASALIEIKSRLVLPAEEENEESIEDPRADLVSQLLEYKKYRDAASILEERSRQWQQRYARMESDLPTRKRDPAAEPLAEVELWDLVSALGRILREHEVTQESNIVYDDTSIEAFMENIHGQIVVHSRVALSDSFDLGMHKSGLIGVFLAVLELVRHHHVLTEQGDSHGEIWLTKGEHFSNQFEQGEYDNYDHSEERPSS